MTPRSSQQPRPRLHSRLGRLLVFYRRLLGAPGWLLCLGLLLVACNPSPSGSPSPEGSDVPAVGAAPGTEPVAITVSAAASLQDVLGAIALPLEQAHPNLALSYNFAASGKLQQQIEQGAPADVFFSAGGRQMDALEHQGLILPPSRRDVLTNRLVLIAAADAALEISQFEQLPSVPFERLAVGEFRTVPAGQYSEELFQRLNILAPLQGKFVFGSSVRNVLAAVHSGNAELGVVYATDARRSDRVKVLATARPDFHAPIVYPIAIVQASPHPEAAQRYLDFLTTDRAKTIFQDFGFGLAD